MASPFHIIEHPDGRRYAVRLETFHDRYEPEGFADKGLETPADHVVAVPRPKAQRSTPRAKGATKKKPALKSIRSVQAAPEPEAAAASEGNA